MYSVFLTVKRPPLTMTTISCCSITTTIKGRLAWLSPFQITQVNYSSEITRMYMGWNATRFWFLYTQPEEWIKLFYLDSFWLFRLFISFLCINKIIEDSICNSMFLIRPFSFASVMLSDVVNTKKLSCCRLLFTVTFQIQNWEHNTIIILSAIVHLW